MMQQPGEPDPQFQQPQPQPENLPAALLPQPQPLPQLPAAPQPQPQPLPQLPAAPQPQQQPLPQLPAAPQPQPQPLPQLPAAPQPQQQLLPRLPTELQPPQPHPLPAAEPQPRYQQHQPVPQSYHSEQPSHIVFTLEHTKWVLAELLAIFPDACPEAAAADVRAALLEAHGHRDSGLQRITEAYLGRGYKRRVKKYQQLRDGAGSSPGPSGPSTQVDYFDLAGRPAVDQRRARRAALDVLNAEFPYVTMLSLNSVLAAHRHLLAPSFVFLHRLLAQAGMTPKSHWSGDGERRWLTVDKQATPLRPEILPDQIMFLVVRRPRNILDRATEQLRILPELALELQAARDQCRGGVDAADVASSSKTAESGAASGSGTQGTSTEQFECECCFGMFACGGMIQCPAGHPFCRECLNGYIREKAFGSGAATYDCMTDGCNSQFLPSQVHPVLDPKVLAKFEERLQEENLRVGLNADPNFVRCPTCQWGAIVDPGVNVFSCQNCELESCRHCGLDWAEHFGKKCIELEQKGETQLRREYEERMSRARLRECPGCHASLVKTEGCNHMTCRCRAHFCYVCRQALTATSPYLHFCRHPMDPRIPGCPQRCNGCPLYTNSQQDDDQAIRELQEEARKRRRQEGYNEDKPIGPPSSPKQAKH